jgi:Ca2+-transporting ATPase
MADTSPKRTGRSALGDPAYRLSAAAVLEQLQTDPDQGLPESRVAGLRQRYGENVLEERGREPAYKLFVRQFQDLLIVVLMVAAALAYYLDDLRGASILLAIILINAAIGVYQEYKAERLLERLRTLVKTRATVVRDGAPQEVDESGLVPGDIVMLEAGAAVPADLRLLESNEFATNDFSLTGESVPQDKDADLVLDAEVPLSDQDNMVFLGTTVARGSATGVVVATGMATVIGDIAQIGQTIRRDLSPLQQEINTLARTLTKLAGVIAVLIFAANVFLRGDAFPDTQSLLNASLLFAISVATACVPQGLPAQITVALSLGVGRLARERAVVKRLSAVETLGCTTIICTDKTGTVTANEMTIVRGWADGRSFEVTGEGYDPDGDILEGGKPLSADELDSIKQFFQHGLLASAGRTHAPDDEHRTWYAVGDPTEAAFMPFALKAGLDPEERTDSFPLVQELPFDSQRKRMTMVRRHKEHTIGYMKGAAESVLQACSMMHADGRPVPLDDKMRAAIAAQVEAYSSDSLRVIALAYRDFPDSQQEFPADGTECDFVFAGLVAMLDPPRPGVRDAIAEVCAAHVRVIMITGDDPITADAIAERIGMPDGPVITGDELRDMTDVELTGLLDRQSLIFSRVSPTDKYRIVKLLKASGQVVAVTGDGVNDTLSLKEANIGVAMGKLGSDVAKEAAEIVLIDDDFTTLVNAVREGRTIFQNLKSVILASITSNVGELACVCVGFIGIAFGLPIPITAVQILSVDLIGEMLPLMALTFDPPDRTLMRQPPRKLGAHIVDGRRLAELGLFGMLMGISGYASFYMVLLTGGSTETGQAAAFTGIVLTQYVNILSRRAPNSIFSAHLFSNPQLWLAISVSLLVVATIVTVPAVGLWFGFEPMQLEHWIWPMAFAGVFLICFEARKILGGRAHSRAVAGRTGNRSK